MTNPYANWGKAAARGVGSRLVNKQLDKYVVGPLDQWIQDKMSVALGGNPSPVTTSYASPLDSQVVASPMADAVQGVPTDIVVQQGAPVVSAPLAPVETVITPAADVAVNAAPLSAEMGTVVGGAAPAIGEGLAAGAATEAELAAPLAGAGAATGAEASAGAGAAAGSTSLAGIPVAGWIALGMMASSQAYDRGYRADMSAKGTNAFNANHMLNITDSALQGLGVSPKVAAILSGSALGSAAEQTGGKLLKGLFH